MNVIGAPLNRVDGKLKVTGAAKYSAEFEIRNLAYAVLIDSTVPSGRIEKIDTAEAAQQRRTFGLDTGQCS